MELNSSALREKTKRASFGWMAFKEGDEHTFTIDSEKIFSTEAGDEGLDGKVLEWDRLETRAKDESDGMVKVLGIPVTLARLMLQKFDDAGRDWDKDLQGSKWHIKRTAKWTYDIDLFDTVKPKKENKYEGDVGKIFETIENNKLYEKQMTPDILKTVLSSLTTVKEADIDVALETLVKDKLVELDKKGVKFNWS